MLTLNEVKTLGLYYVEYADDVYKYRINNKYTLVENNVTVFKDVIECWWYAEGFYVVSHDPKNYTIDIYYNGELFVKDATNHTIFSNTQFDFQKCNEGGYTLVNDGKILVENCEYCLIYDSSYLYAKYDDNGNLTETIVELTKDN